MPGCCGCSIPAAAISAASRRRAARPSGSRSAQALPASLRSGAGTLWSPTSLPRNGAFKGLELKENVKARDGEQRCGAYIFDIRNGDILHWIKLDGAVREMFRCELRRQGAYVRR